MDEPPAEGMVGPPKPVAVPAGLAAAGIVALALLPWLPLLRGDFFWDDSINVVENPTLHSLHGLQLIWTEPRASYQYYPLTYSLFWAEMQLFGPRPGPFHAVNLVLHLANSLLAWRVLRLALPRGAWLGAALFAVHPLQGETVGWITEQKNLLSTMFTLAAFLCWDRSAASNSGRWYAAALLMFVAALLAKTVALTLAPVLVVWELWRRPDRWRKSLLLLLPWFALGIGAGRVTSWRETATSRTNVGPTSTPPKLSIAQKSQVAGRAAWFYVGKLFWPRELLLIYPRWSPDPTQASDWLWPVGVATALAALAIGVRKWGGGPLAGALSYGLLLGPTLGVLPFQFHCHSYVADHFAYLAVLPLIGVVVAGVSRLPSTALPLIGAAAVVGCIPPTWRHSRVMADPVAAWQATSDANPAAWAAHNNLGELLLLRGRGQEAVNAWKKAIQAEPINPAAEFNLGTALAQLGDVRAAEEHLFRSIQMDLKTGKSWFHLGNVLAQQAKFEVAADVFINAADLMPNSAAVHAALGRTFLKLGRRDEARKAFLRAVQIDPSMTDARDLADRIERGQTDFN